MKCRGVPVARYSSNVTSLSGIFLYSLCCASLIPEHVCRTPSRLVAQVQYAATVSSSTPPQFVLHRRPLSALVETGAGPEGASCIPRHNEVLGVTTVRTRLNGCPGSVRLLPGTPARSESDRTACPRPNPFNIISFSVENTLKQMN